MLDAFVELAKTKTPAGGKSLLRDNAVIQSQVGVAEAQLAAARAFFFAAWDEIWQAAQDDAMTLDQRVRLRMASIHASQQARQVVETAYLAAGATAVFESNPFERRFRDMHAVSQQAQSQFAIFEVIGRHFLGLPLQSAAYLSAAAQLTARAGTADHAGQLSLTNPDACVMIEDARSRRADAENAAQEALCADLEAAGCAGKAQAVLPAHLEYMIGLEKRGLVVRLRPLVRRRRRRRAATA